MSPPRLLIAGIGNIFFGDDGFGVEVAQQLGRRRLPTEARVVDFGIRGIDLTYALLDGYEFVVLVDAIRRGGPPGTVYLIEPETEAIERVAPEELLIQAHSLDPARVLRLARSLGGRVRRVLLVGCEPSPQDADEQLRGLSRPVQAAAAEAVSLLERVARELLADAPASTAPPVPHVANPDTR